MTGVQTCALPILDRLYAGESEAQRLLGKEKLDSGVSIGSHSIGVRIMKYMSREGREDLEKYAGGTGTDLYRQITENRMKGLFDMSVEQLKDLQENAPIFWSQLDKDVQEYLNKIIELGDAYDDAKEQWKEWWTQTSVESISDSFASAIDSMDDQTKTFSNNFTRSEERRVGKECRSRWSPYH